MKRYFIITVLLFCFGTLAAAQDPVDDYASQLIKATPAALPQSPVAKRQGSDARDALLKGRVQSVVNETEPLDGTEYPPGRRLNVQQEFGVDGNFIREIFHDYRGNLSFVVVFGYIDGKRVSKAGTSVRHSYDPPPLMALPSEAATPPPKGDNRYTSGWEYKYDKEGRLIEELNFNNSGKAINKTTYVYGDFTRTAAFCSPPCPDTLTTKWDLDRAGNVIKAEYDNPQTIMPVDSVKNYKYLSFDPQGNWTKREVTGRRAASPSSDKPIHYFEYRTIKYY